MDPFIGEIKITPFGYAPKWWASCDGQVLPLNQNQALFALIGISFGGNGQTTFALPDLRGRMPMHRDAVNNVGAVRGEAAHTLTKAEIPMHNHLMTASAGTGTSGTPIGHVPAASRTDGTYSTSAASGSMSATVAPTGGSQPHENRSPFLGMNFIIALNGIWPSQS